VQGFTPDRWAAVLASTHAISKCIARLEWRLEQIVRLSQLNRYVFATIDG